MTLMFLFYSLFPEQYVEQEKEGLTNPKLLKKFGYGNLNRPLKNSWCPIHFAALNQHQVRLLTLYVLNFSEGT